MSDVDKLSGTGVLTTEEPTFGHPLCVVDSKAIQQKQWPIGAKTDAVVRLKATLGEYGADESTAIHPSTVSMAESFLRALPDGIPLPEFSVEPDGFISMDWITGRDRVFSISVGTHHRFACAWIDGTNEGHFAEGFDGQRIPRRIIDGIKAIVTN